jgi:hypothetical protein
MTRPTGKERKANRIPPLDDETRAAIREGLEQARRGELVPDEEMQALWKRSGL